MDSDKDGFVTKEESSKAVKAKRDSKQAAVYSTLLVAADTDKDGKVSKKEFFAAVSKSKPSLLQTEEQDEDEDDEDDEDDIDPEGVWEDMDSDKDGFVTKEESSKAVKANRDSKQAAVYSTLLVAADTDKDGKVSKKEFFAAVSKSKPSLLQTEEQDEDEDDEDDER
eukprot:TRINITY_DN632_c0_g1_i1.p1 TRINITY_DN632_c0_g1~~TRINITY_DN632_c0_g1_i1.p1  ORF type:complete len:189 (-),score=87.29 TRINITY_DN632_c0_g1_i1:459-959(-)